VPGAFHVVVWTTAALDTIRRGTRNQLRRDSKTDQAKRSKETEADSTHPYPDDHNKATRAETVGPSLPLTATCHLCRVSCLCFNKLTYTFSL
jgi:hypothetical protein